MTPTVPQRRFMPTVAGRGRPMASVDQQCTTSPVSRSVAGRGRSTVCAGPSHPAPASVNSTAASVNLALQAARDHRYEPPTYAELLARRARGVMVWDYELDDARVRDMYARPHHHHSADNPSD